MAILFICRKSSRTEAEMPRFFCMSLFGAVWNLIKEETENLVGKYKRFIEAIKPDEKNIAENGSVGGWLNPYDVKPSDSNFYAQEDIEELADSFLEVGQQQLTVLGKVVGQFWIVSGHRKNRANILNIERGHEEYKQVRYLYKDMTQSMPELSLLMGNAYNRELTAWEKTQQAKRLKEALLRAKKEDGLKITGKLRDVVAGRMNESSSGSSPQL